MSTTVIRCKRCGRDCNPWPVARPARCSPKNWARCINRNPDDWEFVQVDA